MKNITIILSAFFTTSIFAANVINSTTQNTITQNTMNVSSVVGKAGDWNLTTNEWQRYVELMQGPSRLYYSHLTPVEILGINADNEEDLRHFAELFAKEEHDKIEKELRFNAAFLDAARRLYANEPIIKPFDLSPYSIQKS